MNPEWLESWDVLVNRGTQLLILESKSTQEWVTPCVEKKEKAEKVQRGCETSRQTLGSRRRQPTGMPLAATLLWYY
jgi:hypothetical protein